MELVAFKFPPLGPEEIRINVTHSGLCRTDLHQSLNDLGEVTFPLCPGHEVFGRVAALGSNVKDFKIGDRVGYGYQASCCEKCEYCLKGLETACPNLSPIEFAAPWLRFGGYSTTIQQPAKFAIKIPDQDPDECTPNLMCAGATLYSAVSRICKPGQRVGIMGIGGLGHIGIQIASKWGCHVTAFTSHKNEKGPYCLQFGAEKVLNSLDLVTLKAEQGHYDVIISTFKPDEGILLTKYLDLLKPFGTFIYLSNSPHIEIDSMQPFITKHLCIMGLTAAPRKKIQELYEFSLANDIRSMVEIYKFEEFPKAWKHLKDGMPLFRCVVDVRDFALKYGLHKTYETC